MDMKALANGASSNQRSQGHVEHAKHVHEKEERPKALGHMTRGLAHFPKVKSKAKGALHKLKMWQLSLSLLTSSGGLSLSHVWSQRAKAKSKWHANFSKP